MATARMGKWLLCSQMLVFAAGSAKGSDDELLNDLELLENWETLEHPDGEEHEAMREFMEGPPESGMEDQDAPPPKRRGRLPYGDFPGT